jgi:hypothetical protein
VIIKCKDKFNHLFWLKWCGVFYLLANRMLKQVNFPPHSSYPHITVLSYFFSSKWYAEHGQHRWCGVLRHLEVTQKSVNSIYEFLTCSLLFRFRETETGPRSGRVAGRRDGCTAGCCHRSIREFCLVKNAAWAGQERYPRTGAGPKFWLWVFKIIKLLLYEIKFVDNLSMK